MCARVTGLNCALKWELDSDRGSERAYQMWVNNRCKRLMVEEFIKDLLPEGGSDRWNARSTGRYIASDAGDYAGDLSEGPGLPGGGA